MPIEKAVAGEPGFFCGLSLLPDELTRVRAHVSRSFMRRVGNIYPDLQACFEAIDLDRYHELSHLIDHKRLWPIVHRILDRDAVQDIRSMSLTGSLEGAFGAFDIADAEGAGHPNMVWRVIRPGHWSDVGPMHADAWFWELGHGRMPHEARRIKVWLAVHCEPSLSGFRVVPASHQRSWPYHGELRDGYVKPTIDIDEGDLASEDLNLRPGQAVVFHDRLLHRGYPGKVRTRVSLEFTLLTKRG